MKIDYTLTPEWVEAFRVETALYICELEARHAERLAYEEKRKSDQRKFESEILQFQRQLISVMNAPIHQFMNDIKSIPANGELRGAQQDVNRWYADMANVAENPPEAAKPIFKLILRQAAYFLLLMLVVGVGLAVFL